MYVIIFAFPEVFVRIFMEYGFEGKICAARGAGHHQYGLFPNPNSGALQL
jgi:hypothetical protein